MSISAWIDIHLSEPSSNNLSVPELIKQFAKEGWDYADRNGEVTFLPLGDGDHFSWYLERILPVFKNAGLQVERVQCEQIV
ncbi:hypothetical protein [Paenibacillus sp. FSL R7-0331]|uniref:hypothetical protein n=1 Tax=Paenibacillus sp. FSL R7-0331 TaxID=1536773 RepID=UPI0004F64F4B|nr:hypothetical protein [Paenibacillus sp. FSL R7-0331]AIQ52243.1 hypothetical protein R70331_12505 [Paenibacillus sp. FSL R7-0331]